MGAVEKWVYWGLVYWETGILVSLLVLILFLYYLRDCVA